MKVFITGINGFIGSALAKSLLERGHEVVGSVSTKEKLASVAAHSAQGYVLRINEEFDPAIFKGVDVLVHCAYDLTKGKGATNLEGQRNSRKWRWTRVSNGRSILAHTPPTRKRRVNMA